MKIVTIIVIIIFILLFFFLSFSFFISFFFTYLFLIVPDADLDGKDLTVINASNTLIACTVHVLKRMSATAKMAGVVFFVTKVNNYNYQNNKHYKLI